MRILVIQTTRMGDVLQTTPLLHALRRRHPGVHIAVMTRAIGVTILRGNPDVDEVITYEEDSLYKRLVSGDSEDLLEAYTLVIQRTKDLASQGYDIVYNVTQSVGSASYLRLAGFNNVQGAALSEEWQFIMHGLWSAYFFASVVRRDHNDLNLCDMFMQALPGAAPPEHPLYSLSAEDGADADAILAGHGISPDDFLVCFQLGASESDKRWPECDFAALAGFLREEYGAKIALLGVQSEAEYGRLYGVCDNGPSAALFGKTSVGQLAGVLKRARLLVTNDTGTMHLAAAMECPVVLISVGYVYFRETGPYGAGHVAIERLRDSVVSPQYGKEPTMTAGQVSPEQVMGAVRAALTPGEALPFIEDKAGYDKVGIYRSAFAPDGCLAWYPLIRRPMTEADVLRMAYRSAMLHAFRNGVKPQDDAATMRGLMACYTPLDSGLMEMIKVLQGHFVELALLAKTGMDASAALIKALKDKKVTRAKELVAELSELDDQTRRLGEIHGSTKMLTSVTRFERNSLEGDDPLALARVTSDIYLNLHKRARLIERALGRLGDIR